MFFNKLLKKYGLSITLFIIILLTDIVSAVSTYLFLTIFRGYVNPIEIIAAVVLPSIISPVFIYAILKNVLRLQKIQHELNKKNKDLIKALSELKQIGGMLPICSSCKKIRDDKGYWNQIEAFISAHSDAEFTHGLCPDCAKDLYSME